MPVFTPDATTASSNERNRLIVIVIEIEERREPERNGTTSTQQLDTTYTLHTRLA
jgi:hypothetical protein